MSPAGHSSDAFRDRRVTPEAPAVRKEPRLRGRRAGRRTAGRPCARRAQSPPRLGRGGRRCVRSGPRREDRGGVGRHVEGEADAAWPWGGQCPGRRRRDRASPPGERSGFHRAAACAPPPAPRAPCRGPDVRATASPTCSPPRPRRARRRRTNVRAAADPVVRSGTETGRGLVTCPSHVAVRAEPGFKFIPAHGPGPRFPEADTPKIKAL